MGRKSSLLILLILSLFDLLQAQVDENRYLVYFSDKDNTPFSIDQPEAFLSNRAIQRRENQGIALTEQDLPVDPAYIQGVQNLGNVEIIYPLKWFNAILVETTDPDVLSALAEMENVTRLELSTFLDGIDFDEEERFYSSAKTGEDYGPSLNQIEMINGLPLHEDGFTGEGIWVGVFDGGFQFANTALALHDFYNSDRILATKNFVDGNEEVNIRSSHGTRVLSTMTGFIQDSLIGTGYGASYALCITEDVTQERRIEEANWARAAEYADSLGVDIINSSLGYTVFDVIEDNYTYADMDGQTTLITRAADRAASKGILIVTSAGNDGNSNWHYISAPADGDSVLAIGAVAPSEISASFSSRGPSFDGRVKPNVCAQGALAIFTDLENGIGAGNGTSFSSPIIAGMAASLWQAFPEATAWQLFQSIEQSASLYENPNDSLGYGIPDFEVARQILGMVLSTEDHQRISGLKIYPNPLNQDLLTIDLPQSKDIIRNLCIYATNGQVVYQKSLANNAQKSIRINLEPASLSKGIYILEARSSSGGVYREKLLIN